MAADACRSLSREDVFGGKRQSFAQPIAYQLLRHTDGIRHSALVAFKSGEGSGKTGISHSQQLQNYCDKRQQESCSGRVTRGFVGFDPMVVSPDELRKTRELKGWSQGTLAEEARKLAEHDGHPGKLTQQSIGNYELGKAKREPTWMRYAMAALKGATAPIRSEVASAGLIGREVFDGRFGSSPLPAIPHYGTGLGGDYGNLDENIELTELHAFQVIEHLARPASLATDTDAYVITVVGDSMVPRFRPRQRVTVSPRASISIGDWVVVQLKGHEGGDERITTVLIKELVRRSATFVELKQYNPELTFRIEQSRVGAMHKVLGDYY